MNLMKTPRLSLLLLFLGFGLLLMPRSSSGAAEPPSLTCNVTHQPDGSFFYQPSWLPRSPSCGTSWTHPNDTVITRDSDFDCRLVQNLTMEGVYLKLCLDQLKYIEECDGNPEEMICKECPRLLGNDTVQIATESPGINPGAGGGGEAVQLPQPDAVNAKPEAEDEVHLNIPDADEQEAEAAVLNLS
ncbi:Hypothetical predicted protein [Scomber scombrus]|uniref:Uncharacterized protein n=1 Tax=Scomber scombrus TaxID=13677 RepID=A0AAV1QHC5_SCOSC